MDDEYDEDHNWDDDQPMEEPEVDPATIQEKCLEQFGRTDFIMEPGIFSQLKNYFQAGGVPEKVIDLLSLNYTGTAQMSNLLAEWLILSGVKVDAVQSTVENHLKEMIIKCFDPKKSDDEFSRDEGSTSWWTEIIEFSTWRSLIYKLAEDYPDCVMLNFMIKLISDAGYQAEITSIATASQQIEVFSRILKTSISNFLSHPDEMEKNLQEFTKMVCHGEHTYLYSQAILQVLSQEPKGGSNIRRLSQEINNCAWKNCSHNITPITMALSGAAAHPRVSQALSSMLARSALNPADITVLYKLYTQPEPPPIDLLRVPQFLDLLVDALFKPGSKLNPEHKPKYIYLLAYAASIHESYKKNVRKSLNKEELKPTMQAVEKVQTICSENKSGTELVAEVNTIYQCIRFPVLAIGIIRWVDFIVSDPSYFKLTTEHTPLHLAMLDEVVSCHTSLHQKVLDLLIRLFESHPEDLDVLVQLERRKMLLDRMVHLFSKGCVVPVMNYIKTCWQQQDTDISLIRYFVTEVLDIISPPYTSEFAQLFLPMVENEEITGSMRMNGDNDLVSEFIVHCHGILK